MTFAKTKISDHERSEDYKCIRKNYAEEFYDKIVVRCREDRRKRHLDVATGPGIVIFDLINRFEESVGIDFSPDRIAEANQERNRLNAIKAVFQVVGADAIPFPHEHFDLVTVGQAFQYFPQPNSIRELYRISREGGIISIFWKYPTRDSAASRLANNALSRTNSTLGTSLRLRDDMKPKLDHLKLPDLLSESGFKAVEFCKLTADYGYAIEDWVSSVIWAIGGGDRSILKETFEFLRDELHAQLKGHSMEEIVEGFDHFLWSARK